MMPDIIEGMRVIKHKNGNFSLPRKPSDKALLALDCQFARKKELTWGLADGSFKVYTDLLPLFEGGECYIIGKGPSLDRLEARHFRNPTAPVIAINQAIHKVETLDIPNPIFCMQQDEALGNSCMPSRGSIIVSTQAMLAYTGFERRYVFAPLQLKANIHTITAVCAIKMAKELGVDSFNMLCFDACVTKETTYANCVGRPDTGNGNRFLDYCKVIQTTLDPSLVEWCVPGVVEYTGSQSSRSYDIRQQLLSNREERHDTSQYHDPNDDLAIEDLPSSTEQLQLSFPLDHSETEQ